MDACLAKMGAGKRERRSRALGGAVLASGVLAASRGGFVAAPAASRPSAAAGRSSVVAADLRQEPLPVSVASAPTDAAATQVSALLPMAAAAAAFGATTRKAGRSTTQVRSSGAAAAPGGEDEGFPEWLPRASLFLFACFCSTNFTFLKVLEEAHGGEAVACARFALAAIPFLPFVAKNSDWLSIKSGVEIGLWCAVAYISQAMGLAETEASKGAFICSLAMVVVPIAKSFTGGEVPKQLWGSVGLAVFGTGMLLGVGGDAGPNHGDLLCLGCALGFGLMFFRMGQYSQEKDFNDLGCTIWQVITLAICMAAWLFCTAGIDDGMAQLTAIAGSEPTILATLLWVSFVTTAGVLYVETWAMKRVEATEAGIIFATEPVWATIFAAYVLGETLGVSQGIGGCFIMLACLLTEVNMDDVLANLRGESKSANNGAIDLPLLAPSGYGVATAAATAGMGLMAFAEPTGAY